MNLIEKAEISLENTNREIEIISMELQKIKESRIPEDIKREFSNRLASELVWLEDVLEDEKKSLDYFEMMDEERLEEERQQYEDLAVDCGIEEYQLNKHGYDGLV